uniref:Uncharacterized protein n=1 Tax=Panagrolaimus sp. ES5 TaxID=591445 RepID=A0AC34FDE8_9BILA
MATFKAKIDDSLVLIIFKIIVEIILATIVGAIFGLIIWLIPSKNIGFYHFSRFIIAVLVSLGFYFITYSHDLLIAGPLIVCIICVIASFQWKHDNHHGEKLFASICFIPKATVQAALAPPLTFFILSNMETKQYANLVLQTCILSILITAPIGELIILFLGRSALSKVHVVNDISSNVPPTAPLPTNNNVETIPIETFQQHTYTKVDDLI